MKRKIGGGIFFYTLEEPQSKTKQGVCQKLGGMLGKIFLGHQFKSGHFKCKTQIWQNNWVDTPRKVPNPHTPYIVVSVPVDQKVDF